MCSGLTLSLHYGHNLTCPSITKVMRSTSRCNGLYCQNEIFMSIAMFDGLHIDLAALKTAENLRESSGWTGELVQSYVATSG